MHRAPRPWWSRLVAPVVVFLIAGAVAFLVATYLWKQEVVTPEEPTPTIEETVQSTVTSSPEPTVSTPTSVPPTESATPTPVVQFDAKVAVLNASGISGLAAKNQKILENGGFTKVTAGNVTGDKPDANVVVYASEDLKATAEEVAKELGIDSVSLDVPQSGAKVEAILVTDPSK